MPGLTDLERRCVLPFYMTMTGLNAPSHGVPFDALCEVARETTDDEVAALLGSRWRPRVMGAWLASGRTQRLEAALLKSLETSQGRLTADATPTGVGIDDQDRRAVDEMLTVACRLSTACPPFG